MIYLIAEKEHRVWEVPFFDAQQRELTDFFQKRLDTVGKDGNVHCDTAIECAGWLLVMESVLHKYKDKFYVEVQPAEIDWNWFLRIKKVLV